MHAVWNFANWSAGGRKETGIFEMIIEDDAIERIRMVGTVSYVGISIVLTLGFWFVHRRNVRREAEH